MNFSVLEISNTYWTWSSIIVYGRKSVSITKTCLFLTPLNSTFFIVNLGFTGLYMILFISAINIDRGTR